MESPERSRRRARRQNDRFTAPRVGRHESSFGVRAGHQLRQRRNVGSAAAPDHVRDDSRPARLMRSAEPGAVVAVEVLAEENVVLPRRVGLHLLDPAEAGSSAVLPDEEQRDEPAADVIPDLGEGVLAAPSRSDTRA